MVGNSLRSKPSQRQATANCQLPASCLPTACQLPANRQEFKAIDRPHAYAGPTNLDQSCPYPLPHRGRLLAKAHFLGLFPGPGRPSIQLAPEVCEWRRSGGMRQWNIHGHAHIHSHPLTSIHVHSRPLPPSMSMLPPCSMSSWLVDRGPWSRSSLHSCPAPRCLSLLIFALFIRLSALSTSDPLPLRQLAQQPAAIAPSLCRHCAGISSARLSSLKQSFCFPRPSPRPSFAFPSRLCAGRSTQSSVVRPQQAARGGGVFLVCAEPPSKQPDNERLGVFSDRTQESSLPLRCCSSYPRRRFISTIPACCCCIGYVNSCFFPSKDRRSDRTENLSVVFSFFFPLPFTHSFIHSSILPFSHSFIHFISFFFLCICYRNTGL